MIVWYGIFGNRFRKCTRSRCLAVPNRKKQQNNNNNSNTINECDKWHRRRTERNPPKKTHKLISTTFSCTYVRQNAMKPTKNVFLSFASSMRLCNNHSCCHECFLFIYVFTWNRYCILCVFFRLQNGPLFTHSIMWEKTKISMLLFFLLAFLCNFFLISICSIGLIRTETNQPKCHLVPKFKMSTFVVNKMIQDSFGK